MQPLLDFLAQSYTAYHAVAECEKILQKRGFLRLFEGAEWNLARGQGYYVVRGGSSLIAFTMGEDTRFQIVASHTDSPCFQLKENPVLFTDGMKKLNVEPYGGSIYYTFFDRPLRLAGRILREIEGKITPETFVSDYQLVIPSVAVHQQRGVNEGFSPNAQVDLLPLYSLAVEKVLDGCLAFDAFAVCDEKPFLSGAEGEFISSPRIDNLTSVFASISALALGSGINVCACLDNEEVGSRTYQGAGSDFLSATLKRIGLCRGLTEEEYLRSLARSFLISLDNAHAVHPNHPEKSDLSNRAVMGKGVVIKRHAGGAYTSDGLTSAVIKSLFERKNIPYQSFYNRSDVRSGSTLGAINFNHICIPSVDLGLAQLAMHSAVETCAKVDYEAILSGLTAFYEATIQINGETYEIL